MTAERVLPLLVAVPLLGAALLVGAGRWLPRYTADVFGFLVSGGTGALAVAELAGARGASEPVEWVAGWRPEGGSGVGIVLVGDGAGLGLAALISALVTAALVYSRRFFDEPPPGQAGAFPALLLLFQAGMCGFVLTGDLFNAFVFFELMGVIAYALTGYRVEEARAVQGALTFGFVNSLGGYATLLGIGLLYARTGELGFAQIGAVLDAAAGGGDALVTTGFALVATGLLVKAAAVPFHFWLPDAHSVAPTPVCMLLSGVMVELGVYGIARLYWATFAGPGGVPAADAHRVLLVQGVLTAVLGAVMCWQQRHLKRLLAFSTIAHTGLFLTALSALTPEATTGVGVYLVAHAGVKAALFGCVGVLLDRFGSVDERELHGRGRELPFVGVLFAAGGLALAGLPPFGTALGKALCEEAAGPGATVLFVAVSAVTGAAVLRTAAGVFLGAGEPPAGPPHFAPRAALRGERKEQRAAASERRGTGEFGTSDGHDAASGPEQEGEPETTGSGEEPETAGPVTRAPDSMLVATTALLAGGLAVGCVPALWPHLAHAADGLSDHSAYVATVFGSPETPPASTAPNWTVRGVLLDLLATLLALVLARTAPRITAGTRRAAWARPLRRLHSGHVGDYVACTVAGMALLGLLLR